MNEIRTVQQIPLHCEQEGISVNQLLQNSSMPQRLVLQMSHHKTEKYFGTIGFESTEPDYMQLTTYRLTKLYCINNKGESQWIKQLVNQKRRRKTLKESISSGYFNDNGQHQILNQLQIMQWTIFLFLFMVFGAHAIILIFCIFRFIYAKKQYQSHLHEWFIWDAKEIYFNHTLIYQLISKEYKAICNPIQHLVYKFPFGYIQRQNQLEFQVGVKYLTLGIFLLCFLFIIMASFSKRFGMLIKGVHPLQQRIYQSGGPLRLVYPSYHIAENQVQERRYNNYLFVQYDDLYLSSIAREREKINKLNYWQ